MYMYIYKFSFFFFFFFFFFLFIYLLRVCLGFCILVFWVYPFFVWLPLLIQDALVHIAMAFTL
jgi:hypothetical protein